MVTDSGNGGLSHIRCAVCMLSPFRVRKIASIKADVIKAQNIGTE